MRNRRIWAIATCLFALALVACLRTTTTRGSEAPDQSVRRGKPDAQAQLELDNELGWAAANGELDRVKDLLAKGANIEAMYGNEETPR